MTKAIRSDDLPPTATAGARFERLVEIMRTLRSPGGCAWDREQTVASLRPFVLEEAYEVVEAMDRNDRAALCEELGDLLLEAVFVAQICAEDGDFTIADAADAVTAKLIRRHPHVFGAAASGGAASGDLSPSRSSGSGNGSSARSAPAPPPIAPPCSTASPRRCLPCCGRRASARAPPTSGSTGTRRSRSSTRRMRRWPNCATRSQRAGARKSRKSSAICSSPLRTPPASCGSIPSRPPDRQHQVHPTLSRGRAAPRGPRTFPARRLARRARTGVAGGQGRGHRRRIAQRLTAGPRPGSGGAAPASFTAHFVSPTAPARRPQLHLPSVGLEDDRPVASGLEDIAPASR